MWNKLYITIYISKYNIFNYLDAKFDINIGIYIKDTLRANSVQTSLILSWIYTNIN